MIASISNSVYAQGKGRLARLAEEAKSAYEFRNYEKALSLAMRGLQEDAGNLDLILLVAEVHHETGQTEGEIEFLEKARFVAGSPALIDFRLGSVYLKTGQYEKAFGAIERYLSGNPSQGIIGRAKEIRERARFSMEAVNNPVAYAPVILGPEINSVNDEYWPALTVDGNTLIFTRLLPISGNQESFQEDFFLSRKENNGWTPAEPVGSVNSPLNEGAQTISADGNLLFFTLCNHPEGFGSCDIWFSRNINGSWTAPRNAGPTLNTPSWESQPSVSSMGDIIYFSSNRPGGMGNKDIWSIRLAGWRPDGLPIWDRPVNLGDSINTPGDEISPFIHHDGKTLFFSSDYWPGLGGFDLFSSRVSSDGIREKAKNMGYPINSHRNEQGLVIDRTGVTAYLASDRETGNGMDIFSFELDERLRPEPVTFVQGKVTDRKTGSAVSALVKLTGIEAGKKFETELAAGRDGTFTVTLPAGQEFAFHVNHPGYLFYSEHFFVEPAEKAPEPIVRLIGLTPVEVGSQTHLYNMFFQTGSSEILPPSLPELESLASFLTENPNLLIEVQGHTDNVGSESFNLELSEKRAGSVVDYLVNKGIPAETLSAKGYGYSSPVESNETEEGRSKNRRTTILITGISQPPRP